MTILEVYEYFGSGTQACESLGMTRQSFSVWKRLGRIPYYRQLVIEKETGGALKAGDPDGERDDSLLTIPKSSKLPRYRYYSNGFGLCDVTHVRYLPDGGFKIKFLPPGTIGNAYATSSASGLLRESGLVDSDGILIFEGDVLSYKMRTKIRFFKFESMEQMEGLVDVLTNKNVKVIGNIFDGVSYE